MGDLISRADAISVLEIFTQTDTLGHTPKQIVEALPSAQPEQRWIPCSERLPEVGQDILMSVGGMYTAEGCLREDGDWAQFRWDTIQRKDMVGVWMPLPDPYKIFTEPGENVTEN